MNKNLKVNSVRRFSGEEELELEGSKTHENLKAAFAGEAQANRRYLFFAQKAGMEASFFLPFLFGIIFIPIILLFVSFFVFCFQFYVCFFLFFRLNIDVEGLTDVARLFRDTGDGETGHANGKKITLFLVLLLFILFIFDDDDGCTIKCLKYLLFLCDSISAICLILIIQQNNNSTMIMFEIGHLYFLEQVGDPVTGEPIGDTKSNLKSAIIGETHEVNILENS